MGYNAYTSDDENHLIKYIATFNSDGKGRRGNALYKRLSENQDNQWPWNKRHPWQSWRDHYVRNDMIMDKKIKAYQKRHGIAVGPEDDKKNIKKHEKQKPIKPDRRSIREGAANTHEEQYLNIRKRESESPSSQSYAKKRKIIKEEPVGIEDYTLAEKGGEKDMLPGTYVAQGGWNEEMQRPLLPGEHKNQDTETTSNSRGHATFSRETPQMVVQRNDDIEEHQQVDQMLENVSESNTSNHKLENAARGVGQFSPRPSFPVVTMKSVGPSTSQSDSSYNSLFDLNSDELVPDSEEEIGSTGSGVNSHHRSKEDDFFRSSPEVTASSEAVPCYKTRMPVKKRRQPPILREGPFVTTLEETTSRTYQSRDSSVGGRWPPVRGKPHTHSSQNEVENYQPDQFKRASNVNDDRKILFSAEVCVAGKHPAQPSAPVLPPARSAPIGSHSFGQTTPHILRRQSSEILQVETSMAVGKRSPPMQDDLRRSDSPEMHDGASHRNSLLLQVERHYRVRRSDKPVYNNDNYLDLHQERKKFSRQSINSLNLSRSGSVMANPPQQSPSLSLQLPMQDQSLVSSLGIQQVISMMSKNHGFTEDVVSRILQNVNSITKADEILRLMRIKAEEEATKQLMAEEQPNEISASNYKRRKSSSIADKLQISELSDEDQLSDYSPPQKTRAGQFTRLVEQGRCTEAYTREARRASGTISPIKLLSNISDTSNREDGVPLLGADGSSSQSPPVEVRDDDIFPDHWGEEVEGNGTGDVQELRDAHIAAADALKRIEGGMAPHRSLDRFQQTAMFLKEILVSHQT